MQEYLGRSPLRCDLAISEANGEQFSLGALLDGDAAAVANVGEPWQILVHHPGPAPRWQVAGSPARESTG
ncbi:hypothetical protein [Pseudomonas protegens]|uniref:hypothetical protein n=1 Tax=Pseudomonas protegens TaxID=380021 RepID=UPI0010139791|nr:hypothetical protein [Pseudomonas protegens]